MGSKMIMKSIGHTTLATITKHILHTYYYTTKHSWTYYISFSQKLTIVLLASTFLGLQDRHYDPVPSEKVKRFKFNICIGCTGENFEVSQLL